ncbi:NUDIX hydrolase [Moraxella macacae 0408225]|uniref:8-oxo-dGTP diphosphatase n=1 Tax=Moraxella macacae 0408225 TaxID=1230338 RepID=L2F6F4_9GAMM|nr:NUDIX domain-containing protein [Moraxella macacae]ELA08495.1 NUDIX hydrolase [Moraxella macacae 0408225]
MKKIQVSLAVIEFDEQFLLGFRNKNQHQGDCYEFIGGKIDNNETPKSALIREVSEEIGVDIRHNHIINMGQIWHDYVEDNNDTDKHNTKSVVLFVFKVVFTRLQFDSLQGKKGAEQQPIVWVKKADLLNKKYPLPNANTRILTWLAFANQIVIGRELAYFADDEKLKTIENWVDFYADRLPKNAHFYARLKDHHEFNHHAITKLQKMRTDVVFLLSRADALSVEIKPAVVVLTYDDFCRGFADLAKDCCYFASCHNLDDVIKINALAKTHRVVGIFLSPVKATKTHPMAKPLGFEKFQALANHAHMPVFALGGLSPKDCQIAQRYGAYGVAGIRGFE